MPRFLIKWKTLVLEAVLGGLGAFLEPCRAGLAAEAQKCTPEVPKLVQFGRILEVKLGLKSQKKSIKKLTSFWCCSWRLLGPFWRLFWTLLGAQISPSSAQEVPRSPQDTPRRQQDWPRWPSLFKIVMFQKVMKNKRKFNDFDSPGRSQITPRRPQAWSRWLKIDPRPLQDGLQEFLFYSSFSHPFFVIPERNSISLNSNLTPF